MNECPHQDVRVCVKCSEQSGREAYDHGFRAGDHCTAQSIAKAYRSGWNEAIEKAALVAEINDGREPGGEAEEEAMNIAAHIRALKLGVS